jgi:hypothetical protein
VNKQRIKTNATAIAANITYYGGTIGAGLAFKQLLNDTSALAVATLIVFVLTVEGLLRTLLDEAFDTPRAKDTQATAPVSLTKTN